MLLQPELLNRIRTTNPLIHNVTNIVVANYVANGLLAIGASPIMSHAPQEMDELAKIAGAVAINIGTPSSEQVAAMTAVSKAANQYNVPLLLDPVGVGATAYRRELVRDLLDGAQFRAIRGNAGEMASLAGIAWQSKGVDTGSGHGDLHTIARRVAKRYQTVAVISGEVDVLSDGERIVEVRGGTPLFPQITGSGCLHGAVCAAFLAVADDALSACVTACLAYAVAGARADDGNTANGSFATKLLDSLSRLHATDISRSSAVSLVV